MEARSREHAQDKLLEVYGSGWARHLVPVAPPIGATSVACTGVGLCSRIVGLEVVDDGDDGTKWTRHTRAARAAARRALDRVLMDERGKETQYCPPVTNAETYEEKDDKP
jgi:hypothetical protein